jgi:UDP-N-acetylmuramate dehydrogenase
LKLLRGDRERLQARRREIRDLRASKHPDLRVTPTAGSFFKNVEPTSKAERRQAAGWFLEQVGAKGMRAGGASVYEKHANIIVAEPGCRAADVHALSLRMAEAVRGKFGLELQREVRLVGPFG